MAHETKHKFYDTTIGKIVIGVCTFVTGSFIITLCVFFVSSAQPPKCKIENSEIKQMIIDVEKSQLESSKKQQDFIVSEEKRRVIDSVKWHKDHALIIAIAKKLDVTIYE